MAVRVSVARGWSGALLASIALAFGPAASRASEPPPAVAADVVERLTAALSGVEIVPSADQLFEAFGASAAPALAAVAEDAERPAFARARALQRLADLDPPACGRAATSVLAEREAPRALLRAAAASWIRADPSGDAWEPLAEHPADVVRERAAHGLAAQRPRRAGVGVKLQRMRDHDPSPRVRETAARLLGAQR